MNDTTDMTKRESTAMQERAEAAQVLRPPVNVFEDKNGITVEADMPGVSRDRLRLQVENDQLLVEGEAQLALPEGMEPLYADVRATRYRRTFALSRELDTESIDASLKDGVLTLRIPKRAEHRPRKIEVRVA